MTPEFRKRMPGEALNRVGLLKTVEALPEGLGTKFSWGTLSAGQTQLLSIARAIAVRPRLLLLDEITSDMDARTEEALMQALSRAAEGRTVLSISHRKELLKYGREVAIRKAEGNMKEKKNSISGVLFLLAGAVVWGTTFVAQDTAADQMGAFTYLFGRSIVAVVFLGILILVLDRVGKVTSPPTSRAERRTLWQGGILVGVFCCLASWLQQYGIAFTTAGKAGFLTAFYIVLVPVIGIFLGRRPTIFLSWPLYWP